MKIWNPFMLVQIDRFRFCPLVTMAKCALPLPGNRVAIPFMCTLNAMAQHDVFL